MNDSYNSPEFFERDLSNFEFMNEIAERIGDQNTRFGQVPVVLDGEFADIACEGIRFEQADAVDYLKTSVDELPYAALGRAVLAAEHEVANLQLQIDGAVEAVAGQLQEVDDMLSKTIKLSPLSIDHARELAEKKKRQIVGQKTEEIKVELDLKKDELSRMLQVLDVALSPWPVPVALDYKTPNASTETVIIDEVPVQPRITTRQAEVLEDIRERHVDAPEASLFIALYLGENKGRVVSVDELVEFLYDHEVI